MNCKTCGAPAKEIASKTTDRAPTGPTRCHRLECGHAWHVTTPAGGQPASGIGIEPTACSCREIVTMNKLLAAGRKLLVDHEGLGDESLREWTNQVLEALDGIPAESGALTLGRRATTATKSMTSSTAKKVEDVNRLLIHAIAAVS